MIGARLVGVALVGAVAAAAHGSPTPAAAPPPAAASPQLRVDDHTYAVEPGSAFEATLSIIGTPATIASLAAADAEIRLTVHEAITDAAQVDEADGESSPAVDVAVLAAAPVLTASGAGAEVTLTLPLSDGDGGRDSIDLDAAGIYPLTIEVVAGPLTASARTFVELVDPEAPAPPLSVAVVAAVADADAYGRVVDVAGRAEAPLSVSLLPSVAASSGASETAGDALRLDELLALPAAQLDPSAVVAVDEASAFTRMLREGEDVLSAASPFAVVSRSVWIADRPLSGAGAAMLRDLGVRMLVLTDAVAASLGADAAGADAAGADAAGETFEVDLGDGNTLPAMTIDRRGDLLAAPTGDGVSTSNERAVRLLAQLQLARRGGGSPAVVVAAPDLAIPDAEVTARFAELADEVSDAAVVPLSRLPGIAQGELRSNGRSLRLPVTAGADLSTRRASIESTREAAAHAASMTTSSRHEGWTRRLDALLASDIDDATAGQRLAEIETEVDAVLTAIVAPEPFTFTLTGSSNTLRIPLRNTADEPLRVQVAVRSPKLTIDQPTQAIEVPALSSVEVPVPVQARSQGTFTIEVDVLAPDGSPLGAPVVLKGRVSNARGLSQVATGGAVLVLASWWYMHLRRRRARRRSVLSPAGQ